MRFKRQKSGNPRHPNSEMRIRWQQLQVLQSPQFEARLQIGEIPDRLDPRRAPQSFRTQLQHLFGTRPAGKDTERQRENTLRERRHIRGNWRLDCTTLYDLRSHADFNFLSERLG